MKLPLALLFIGIGGLLIWVGETNPTAGLVGTITDELTGKTQPAKATSTALSIGDLAGAIAGQPPTTNTANATPGAVGGTTGTVQV